MHFDQAQSSESNNSGSNLTDAEMKEEAQCKLNDSLPHCSRF